MLVKGITVVVIVACVLLLVFFTWHYFFSIYEVKLKSSVDSKIIKSNSSINLEVVAINAFGWELSFRDLDIELEVIEGEEFIKYHLQNSNTVQIKALHEGDVSLKIKSNYSLRPSTFTFKITE